MTGWVSAWGSLGEPMSDHLEPPECFECEDDDCPDCYTAADRAMDEAIDELDGRLLEEARSEL